MTLHDYVRIARRNAVLIVAFAVIGVATGMLAALVTPPRYESSTDLYVSVRQGPNAAVADLAQGTSYARQVVTSYVAVMTSAIVLDPVIDELGLDTTAVDLAERIHTAAGTNTVVLTVTVTDSDPEQAARIANTVADSFSSVVAEELEGTSTGNDRAVDVETLQTARVPLEPTAPRMSFYTALGALVGLALGVLIAALRTVLDTRIRTIADVERVTHAPTLGGIAFDPDANRRPLIVAASPRDPRAEAFRALRTNVRFFSPGGATSVFVISSAGPREGKSTTTANLAIALAESGLRVAVVDGDLRLPKIAEYFDIEGGVGLTDVLVGRVAASDVVQRWGPNALFVLPAGATPPNPAELLGSLAMGRLVAELRTAFDVVLIDAPPLLLVTDAAVLASVTDGAILVAAADRTTRPRLADAVRTLETTGARVLGTVVTMLPTRGADKTAYGTYAYATTHPTTAR